MSLYYPEPTSTIRPSKSDLIKLNRVQKLASNHLSGGSYNMVAMYSRGSHRAYGFNQLSRSAITVHADYPEDLGVHAELDLYRMLNNETNGTVYVAGNLSGSGSAMTTTRPCAYCSAILYEVGIKNVVYFQDNIPTKVSTKDLI